MSKDIEQMTHLAFFEKAIKTLRGSKDKGIHSVYSGFNDAFRQYFNSDPVAATKQLTADKKLEIRPVRGGVMLYLPGEAPVNDTAQQTLKKMGL